MNDIYVKLNEVFREVFDDEQLYVSKNTTSDDIADWDSLEHINLIIAVEEKFGVTFEMKEIIGMNNVGEMAELIQKKLSE